MTPLQSLVSAGTKLWVDSVDPDEIAKNRAFGATGATSNPIIIADFVKTGRFPVTHHAKSKLVRLASMAPACSHIAAQAKCAWG